MWVSRGTATDKISVLAKACGSRAPKKNVCVTMNRDQLLSVDFCSRLIQMPRNPAVLAPL